MNEVLPHSNRSRVTDPVLAELVAEITDRLHAGQAVNLEDYLARCPEHADQLRRLLPALQLLDQFRPSTGGGRHAAPPPSSDDPLATQDTASAPPADTVNPDWPVVPGYELLEQLGRGGMGVVYKARQIALDRPVALKMMLDTDQTGPDERARFRSEAEAAAALQHPNIIQIHEIGEVGGRPFIALEFVAGGSLDQQVKTAPLPPRDAASLLETLARAMHHAHERGIIHRDLKPANILLSFSRSHLRARGQHPETDSSARKSERLNEGVPKITDFGLAKRLDSDAGLTQPGAVVGTPSYMAPEQASGLSDRIGPLSDVYALGAVLYETLTSRPPFKAATVYDTIRQVLLEDPVPPSRLQPGLPRDLETICLKCLRKEPPQRYASALELAEDLKRFQEDRPIHARPAGAWERAYRWARREPAKAMLAATIVLALSGVTSGAIFYGLYQGQQTAVIRKQGERRQKIDGLVFQAQQEEDAGHLDTAKDLWSQALTELDADPDNVPQDLRRHIDEHLDQLRQQLQKQADYRQQQTARQELADKLDRFGKERDEVLLHAVNLRNQDAVVNAKQIRNLAPATLATLGLAIREKPDSIASGLLPYQRSIEPQPFAQLASDCFQILVIWAEAEATPAGDKDSAAQFRKAMALLDAASILAQTCQLPIPKKTLHDRRAAYLKPLGDKAAAEAENAQAKNQQPSTALDYFLTALDAYRRQDFSGASNGCEQALRQEPDNFWAQYLQGLCRLRRGYLAEAKMAMTHCLGRQPQFYWARVLRGVALGHLKEYDVAEIDFADALRQADPKDALARWTVLTNRGTFRTQCGRWEDGIADMRQAILEQPNAVESYVSLALAYQHQKKWDEALKTLDQALAGHLADAGLYSTRARLNLAHQNRPAARRDFEQAIALEKNHTAERLADDCIWLGSLQHEAGEFAAALKSFDRALAARPNHPKAHLQRSETLLRLGKQTEAGRALEDYLRAIGKGTPEPAAYLALGLIHFESRAYTKAVEAFTRSLLLQPDKKAASYRGWAYLKLDAPQLALPDFETALRLDAHDANALCGRGRARVRLGQVADAVKDAEEALRHGPRDERFRFSVIGLYAQAAGASRDDATLYRERAIELLDATLRGMRGEKRKNFWWDNVQHEPELRPLWRSPEMWELERRYRE
jgi:serine/threonine protein kinase/tetratricopeptide (TPR) repeat protein